jgi:hypothetical protein
MRKQAASVGGPAAAFGVLLVILASLVSVGAGALTCHEDVGSDDIAPNVCHYGAGGPSEFLQLFALPFVLVLCASRLRTKSFAVLTALFVAAEAAVLLMWILVNHGSIHY